MLWTREHGLSGKPLQNLELIVRFCIKMYFKLYFDICFKNRLEDGPNHILTEIRILATPPDQVQVIVTPHIKTGAWFSHSECCLPLLLSNKDREDRKFAVDIILKIRGSNELGDMSVWPRKTPKLNLTAKCLRELIAWNIPDCHEPVFTC